MTNASNKIYAKSLTSKYIHHLKIVFLGLRFSSPASSENTLLQRVLRDSCYCFAFFISATCSMRSQAFLVADIISQIITITIQSRLLVIPSMICTAK